MGQILKTYDDGKDKLFYPNGGQRRRKGSANVNISSRASRLQLINNDEN